MKIKFEKPETGPICIKSLEITGNIVPENINHRRTIKSLEITKKNPTLGIHGKHIKSLAFPH